MSDDTLRIILAAALLPVVGIAIKLMAKLVVWVFPSLRKHNEPRD